MAQQKPDEQGQSQSADSGASGGQAEGISQFMAKVLDQLSLTAWLPAAMLVGCAAILLQLRSQENFDVGGALVGLTEKPLGILVVLLFALVLAAVVSQAFSFGAIRFLEGYWGPLLRLGVFGLLTRAKAWKRTRLRTRLEKLESRAFTAALRIMMGSEPSHVVFVHVQQMYYDEEDWPWTPEQLADAERMHWTKYIPSDHHEKIASTTKRIDEFPRLLRPTKLGNILRATEEKLHLDDGEEVQGFVLRRRTLLPPRLELHHDQYRNRLDMYCTLVFTYVILAVLSLVLFTTSPMPTLGTAVIVAGFAIMGALSYSAAVASARGYCLTLRQLDRIKLENDAAKPQNPDTGRQSSTMTSFE